MNEDHRSNSPSPSDKTDECFQQVNTPTSRLPNQYVAESMGDVENVPVAMLYAKKFRHVGGRGFGGMRHGFNRPSGINHWLPYPTPVSVGQAYRSGNDTQDASPMDHYSTGRRRSIYGEDRIDKIAGHQMGEDTKDYTNSPYAKECGSHRMPDSSFDYPSTGSVKPSIGHPFHPTRIPYVPKNPYDQFDPSSEDRNIAAFPFFANFGRPSNYQRPSVRSPSPPRPKSARFDQSFGQDSPMSIAPDTPPRSPRPAPASISSASTVRPSHFNDSRPASPTPPASPDPTLMSIVSTSTVQTYLTAKEQRIYHLNNIYNTCLAVSNFYVNSRRTRRRLSSRRYHPYSPSPHRTRHGHASLMTNISTICTHLWHKARNDAAAPHRAESDSLKRMRDLYGWGELVVKGFYSEGVLERDVEMDESDDDGTILRESEMGRIGAAAKKICSFLEDRIAWNDCCDSIRELRALEEREMGSEMSFESFSRYQ